MKIQYLSDIHLELDPRDKFESLLIPSAPYLALCGDIGNPFEEIYTSFLQWCSERFEQVFIIAGNHEFYSTRKKRLTIDLITEQIITVCNSIAKITFLNNDKIYIPTENTYILGTTLWSNTTDDTLRDTSRIYQDWSTDLEQHFPDYERGKAQNLQCSDFRKLHANSTKWLADSLSTINDCKVLVLSHHLPSLQLINPRYKGYDSSGFASNLEYLFPKVNGWLCGHSHNCITLTIGSTQLGMNCVGYFGENTRFSRECVMEI